MSESENDFDSSAYDCPACGEPVPSPTDMMQNLLVCPSCGHQFFIEIAPPDEDDDEAARAAVRREIDKARDLDGLRIRALLD